MPSGRIKRPGIEIDLTPLHWLVGQWTGNRLPEPLGKLWGKVYSRFVRKRWRAGGFGSWRPLAQETIARRRGEGRGVKTLIDTGILINTTTIGAAGNLFHAIKRGVRYGFGGGGRHPSSDKATIAEIATAHDQGLGRVPQRKIIVEPDTDTIRAMLHSVRLVNRRLMVITDRKAKAVEARMRSGLRKARVF